MKLYILCFGILTLLVTTRVRLGGGASISETTESTVGDKDDGMSEVDDKLRSEWGGKCGNEDWIMCYNVTTMGNPTLVDPDDKSKVIQQQIDCVQPESEEFQYYCLKNGWTVTRCHILCMSKCNRKLLLTRKLEEYVLHNGTCKVK